MNINSPIVKIKKDQLYWFTADSTFEVDLTTKEGNPVHVKFEKDQEYKAGVNKYALSIVYNNKAKIRVVSSLSWLCKNFTYSKPIKNIS